MLRSQTKSELLVAGDEFLDDVFDCVLREEGLLEVDVALVAAGLGPPDQPLDQRPHLLRPLQGRRDALVGHQVRRQVPKFL